ncbi:MAG: hypothetical protein HY050_02150 [Actinobacteria bacterium]|nr:hypothetical protein [Actinomycetota bacterium]
MRDKIEAVKRCLEAELPGAQIEGFRDHTTKWYHPDAYGFRIYRDGAYVMIVTGEFLADTSVEEIGSRLNCLGLARTFKGADLLTVILKKDGLKISCSN